MTNILELAEQRKKELIRKCQRITILSERLSEAKTNMEIEAAVVALQKASRIKELSQRIDDVAEELYSLNDRLPA